tara:strand:+ start:324 stop:545 length:222 start_codon:yes stop_codon:yes gene_type:complete
MRNLDDIKSNCALAREPKIESIGIYMAPLGDVIITREKASQRFLYNGKRIEDCDLKGAYASEILRQTLDIGDL